MIADLVPPSSTVVGVDISSQRISLCKNIVQKYHIDGTTSRSKQSSTIEPGPGKAKCVGKVNHNTTDVTIRLHCTDGTTFGVNSQDGLIFDSTAAREEYESRGKRKRMNKSARAREKRRLLELQREENGDATNARHSVAGEKEERIPTQTKNAPGEHLDRPDAIANKTGECIYDRVLVDAECSTDGAMRHIEKRQSSSSSQRSPAWDDTNMDELVDLQKRLIGSGFRLLKEGGVMVYSTCSLTTRQNEQVVHCLLDKHKDAFIIPVSFNGNKKSSADLPFIEEGSIPGTVRFNPVIKAKEGDCQTCLSPGSGFFLAKIGKR